MLSPQEVEAMYRIKRVIVYKNGLEVIRGPRYPMKKHKPPPRKGVYEMSRKAKLRLAHLANNCDIKFNSMITLTYGDFLFPADGKELKRQLNVFLGHLRRRFTCEYIWFLEFQTRGRPHFHIITTITPNYLDKIWLASCWSKTTTYDYVKRLTNRAIRDKDALLKTFNMFDVLEEADKVFAVHKHPKAWDKIRKSDGATRYLLKYASKQAQKLVPANFGNVGHFYGHSAEITAKPLAVIEIGETMSEGGFRAVLGETPIAEAMLIPRYIFQNDALEYYQKKGLVFTEIIGQKLSDLLALHPEW